MWRQRLLSVLLLCLCISCGYQSDSILRYENGMPILNEGLFVTKRALLNFSEETPRNNMYFSVEFIKKMHEARNRYSSHGYRAPIDFDDSMRILEKFLSKGDNTLKFIEECKWIKRPVYDCATWLGNSLTGDRGIFYVSRDYGCAEYEMLKFVNFDDMLNEVRSGNYSLVEWSDSYWDAFLYVPRRVVELDRFWLQKAVSVQCGPGGCSGSHDSDNRTLKQFNSHQVTLAYWKQLLTGYLANMCAYVHADLKNVDVMKAKIYFVNKVTRNGKNEKLAPYQRLLDVSRPVNLTIDLYGGKVQAYNISVNMLPGCSRILRRLNRIDFEIVHDSCDDRYTISCNRIDCLIRKAGVEYKYHIRANDSLQQVYFRCGNGYYEKRIKLSEDSSEDDEMLKLLERYLGVSGLVSCNGYAYVPLYGYSHDLTVNSVKYYLRNLMYNFRHWTYQDNCGECRSCEEKLDLIDYLLRLSIVDLHPHMSTLNQLSHVLSLTSLCSIRESCKKVRSILGREVSNDLDKYLRILTNESFDKVELLNKTRECASSIARQNAFELDCGKNEAHVLKLWKVNIGTLNREFLKTGSIGECTFDYYSVASGSKNGEASIVICKRNGGKYLKRSAPNGGECFKYEA